MALYVGDKHKAIFIHIDFCTVLVFDWISVCYIHAEWCDDTR